MDLITTHNKTKTVALVAPAYVLSFVYVLAQVFLLHVGSSAVAANAHVARTSDPPRDLNHGSQFSKAKTKTKAANRDRLTKPAKRNETKHTNPRSPRAALDAEGSHAP